MLPLPPALRGAVPTMFLGCLAFAGMATCVGLAHRADPELHTIVASAFRALVNLGVLLLFYGSDIRVLLGDRRPALWLRGLFGSMSLMSYFAALSRVGIGEAAFLNNTSSVWVAALAPFVVGEATSLGTWVAVAGSVVGTALLVEPRGDGDGLGRIFGALSGLLAASAYLQVKRASGTNSPQTIVFWFTLIASATCISLVVLLKLSLPGDPVVWVWLVSAGICATVGQLLMTRAFQAGRTAVVAAVGATNPLLTLGLGALTLGQGIDRQAALGMGVLAISGVALPFMEERRRQSREAAKAPPI